MQFLPAILDKLGYAPKGVIGHAFSRGWEAANQDRLTSDWQISSLSSDGELRDKSRVLRARGRDLWMNDCWVKRYIGMVGTNVIGPDGITLKNKAMDFNGKLDTRANTLIDNAFWDWGQKWCDVTSTMPWLNLQRVVTETAARDGEIFVRKVRGFDNPYAFALQLLEADYCPDDYSVEILPNGNRVVMGVELNNWNRPVAYYFTSKHPGDGIYLYVAPGYIRIPANEIIHVFFKARSSQTRAWPWAITAMYLLQQLKGYTQAEVIAARAASCKPVFFTKKEGETKYKGTEKDSSGAVVTQIQPGMVEELPAGLEVSSINPTHPNGNYQEFVKAMLRAVSAALEVSYNTLANDLESTSYSSGRIGVLDERDNWKKLQQWIISSFHQKVFESWLEMALLTGQVPLSAVKYDKFNAATWRPRKWPWVDPLKDMQAIVLELKAKLTSPEKVIEERGDDFIETLDNIQANMDEMKKRGIEMELDGAKDKPQTEEKEPLDGTEKKVPDAV